MSESPTTGSEGQANGAIPVRVFDGRLGAWWVIAISLAVIAVCMVVRDGGNQGGLALAQSVTRDGARGVFAFPGQLSKNSYGVYMVDVDAGTIWVYEYDEDAKGQTGCLRLAASREWLYDRYLRKFNVCGATPEEVQELVDLERGLGSQIHGSERDLQSASDGPDSSVETKTKPTRTGG
jgi:hypothetical protein